MYFLIGVFGGAAAVVRRGEVPALQPARRAAHARRRHRAVRASSAAAEQAFLLRAPGRARHRPPAPSAGCSSASSSRSRSRRRCGRCTPGCPTPPPRRRPAARCCWSACSTRSAPSACSASACRCSPTRRRGFAPVIIVLAVIGILYGALLAIGQTDLKRLIAYTSISHFGFIVLGIFAMTTPGPGRLDALHGQPRLLDRRAVPHRRLPDQPPRLAADRATTAACSRWRRCSPARSWSPACPAWRCPACRASSASSWCWSARSRATRRRRSSPRVGIVLAALYILLMYQRTMTGPVDARQRGAAGPATRGRSSVGRAAARGHRRARLLPAAGARRHQPGGRPRRIEHVGEHRPRAARSPTSPRGARSERPRARRRSQTPSIEYRPAARRCSSSSASAVVGVLVEAFAPRARCATRSSSCSPLGGLVAAFVAGRPDRAGDARAGRRRGRGRRRRAGAVPAGHDPAARVRRGARCIAERSVDPAATPSPRRRRRCRARADERQLTPTGVAQTEVFPLLMFAVGGMLLFPAANDLLTMFVALEVLSLPLYLLCGLARRRRLLSPGGGAEVLPARRVLLGVLPLRRRAALRLRRHRVELSGDRRGGRAPPASSDALLLRRHRAGRGRPAVQGRRGAVPLLDPGRLPGRADADHRRSWPPAPRSRRSARCCGCSTSRSAALRWDWRPMMWVVAILTMVVGVGASRVTQTDVKRMLAYSSIAHAGFVLVGVARDLDRRGPVGARCSTCSPTASRRSARFAVVTLVRDAGRRGDPPVAVGRARPPVAAGRRRCSRSSCSPSPASR